ncbi:MAG TPA: quinolinate synthase NadA [Candidatus Bathyarchaeota archaeon]|nr:quinolinate synthase NadA [Candidatus Bathyarchaeota archaeon]
MPYVEELQAKIRELAERKRAVILAHNYQRTEVQEVADFVGESLFLARKALEVDAELIVFCGVDFMAETAAILNPGKKVVLPDPASTCPMAAQLPAHLVREARRRHPGIPVVLYINTLAEAKAEADVICTSGNAVEVVRALGADRVLFGPDRNLCWHVQRHLPDVEVIPIPEAGYCYVHKLFTPRAVLRLKEERYPNAALLVHPECDPELQLSADVVGSTGQMYKYVREAKRREFLIATEVGLVERINRELPGKRAIPAKPDAICAEMKLVTLEKVLRALEKEKPVVRLPRDIAARAREAVERMLEATGVLKHGIASLR